jgi:hypothetical protein
LAALSFQNSRQSLMTKSGAQPGKS